MMYDINDLFMSFKTPVLLDILAPIHNRGTKDKISKEDDYLYVYVDIYLYLLG